MSRKTPKRLKRRMLRSHFSVIISITLILFMMGSMGLILLNAKHISNYLKENIGITIVFRENTKEKDILKMQKELEASKEIKSTHYVDKEMAAKELQKEIGEEFVDFLGYNPLLASMEVKIHAQYANSDSLSLMEKRYRDHSIVKDVYYQKSIVRILNKNVQRVIFILTGICLLMFIMFITLINNSIRLSIFSQRFTIKTMQLVGATQAFIRRPFVGRGIMYGIWGATLASIMLLIVVFTYQKEINKLIGINNIDQIGLLIIGIYLCGILLSWISTTISVNKFLKMKADELYY